MNPTTPKKQKLEDKIIMGFLTLTHLLGPVAVVYCVGLLMGFKF